MIEIERKGTWPILKYTIRSKSHGYAVVMIDDAYGDVLINPGDQIALLHWWGKGGRGEGKLREFLVRASIGYLKDKFSYGLSRWSCDVAMDDLKKECAEHFGAEEDHWPDSVQEVTEQLEGMGAISSDLFHYIVQGSKEIMEAFGYDGGIGGPDDNREAAHFIDTKWPALVDHWKKELAEEASNVTAQV